jgi:hypothetical protein
MIVSFGACAALLYQTLWFLLLVKFAMCCGFNFANFKVSVYSPDFLLAFPARPSLLLFSSRVQLKYFFSLVD